MKWETQLTSWRLHGFDGLEFGYNHFRLHPDTRKYLSVSVQLPKVCVRIFQHPAPPFGWNRSGYWFSRLTACFWTSVKSLLGYRRLSYVVDNLVAPSVGRASTQADCCRASKKLYIMIHR